MNMYNNTVNLKQNLVQNYFLKQPLSSCSLGDPVSIPSNHLVYKENMAAGLRARLVCLKVCQLFYIADLTIYKTPLLTQVSIKSQDGTLIY